MTFKIFDIITSCPKCGSGTIGTTNDGNRTQFCTNCKFVMVKDGKYHNQSYLDTLQSEMENEIKNNIAKFADVRMVTPKDDPNSDYVVFRSPYIACAVCVNGKCKTSGNNRDFHSLGWSLLECEDCNQNFIHLGKLNKVKKLTESEFKQSIWGEQSSRTEVLGEEECKTKNDSPQSHLRRRKVLSNFEDKESVPVSSEILSPEETKPGMIKKILNFLTSTSEGFSELKEVNNDSYYCDCHLQPPASSTREQSSPEKFAGKATASVYRTNENGHCLCNWCNKVSRKVQTDIFGKTQPNQENVLDRFCTCHINPPKNTFRHAVARYDKQGNLKCNLCDKIDTTNKRTKTSPDSDDTKLLARLVANDELLKDGIFLISQYCHETDPCTHMCYFVMPSESTEIKEVGDLFSTHIEQIVQNYTSQFKYESKKDYISPYSLADHFRVNCRTERNNYSPVLDIKIQPEDTFEIVLEKVKSFTSISNLPLNTKPSEWLNVCYALKEGLNKNGWLTHPSKFEGVSVENMNKYIDAIEELEHQLAFVSIKMLNVKSYRDRFLRKELDDILIPKASQSKINDVTNRIKNLELRTNPLINNTRIKAEVLRPACSNLLLDWKDLQSFATEIKGKWDEREKVLAHIGGFVLNLKEKIASFESKKEEGDQFSTTLSLTGASWSRDLSKPLSSETISHQVPTSFKMNAESPSQQLKDLKAEVEAWINGGKNIIEKINKISRNINE